MGKQTSSDLAQVCKKVPFYFFVVVFSTIKVDFNRRCFRSSSQHFPDLATGAVLPWVPARIQQQ